ncbi:MAG: flavodoxin family protein [Lachnospiraceae bacterium]|nr:flavodoxin family protein [Lachnospiraceae bacterium]
MSKVVGLSWGRKMSNTDVMIKEILLKCQEAGHEIQFLRPDDLDIKPCSGCTACVVGIMSGRNNGSCIYKDDLHILEEAWYSADAVIIGSPVYETSPSGTFKNFCDRMGPSHDLSFLKEAYEERKAAGKTGAELPDERAFKTRVGCIVASGGAVTKNWTVMTIPVMYECMMATGVDVIDTHVYYGAMKVEHVLGAPEQMERMDQMAQNIIDSLAATDLEEKTKWRGAEEGACPVCHQSVFEVFPGSDKVECTICGIEGKVEVKDGKATYTFCEQQQARSRMKYAGKLEHSNEIKHGAMTQKKVEGLKELKEKYLHVGE